MTRLDAKLGGFRPPLLVLLAIAAFPGCTVHQDDKRITLRFAVWATPAQQKVEEEIIRAYEAAQPDVRVRLLAFDFSSYDAKIQTMLVGKEPPDVMLVKNYSYDELASRGVLADLTESAAALDREDPFMPMAKTIFEREGRYFALPVNVHGLVTYVNLDALAAIGVKEVPAAGFTWEEIWRMAPKLSRHPNNPNAPADYALFEPPAYPVLAELGGQLFDNPYHPTRVTIDSAAGRAWVAWCQRLEASGWCTPRSTALDQGTYQLFRDGRVVFFFSGRWQVPDFAGQTSFHWDVRPFPSGPNGRVTMHGGTGISVATDTRQSAAARKFAQFYAGRAGAEISMRAGRTVPVQRNLAHSSAFIDLHPPASPQYYVDTMEAGAAGFWLYAPGAPEVSQIVTRRMDEALSDPSLSPGIVTRRLQDDLQRWLVHQQRNKRLPSP